MKIYDISQEVFNCKVFPGDPLPKKMVQMRIKEGDICNLSSFYMCAHNGTHVDAPYHFIEEGKRIEEVALDKFVGISYVAEHEGDITASDMNDIIAKARAADERSVEHILIKGKATLTEEAARVLAAEGIKLYGNESQTVGPEDSPAAVHHIMLGAEIVLLEGIVLAQVPEGVYLLNAAPLNLGGAEGAPCRALLMEM